MGKDSPQTFDTSISVDTLGRYQLSIGDGALLWTKLLSESEKVDPSRRHNFYAATRPLTELTSLPRLPWMMTRGDGDLVSSLSSTLSSVFLAKLRMVEYTIFGGSANGVSFSLGSKSSLMTYWRPK